MRYSITLPLRLRFISPPLEIYIVSQIILISNSTVSRVKISFFEHSISSPFVFIDLNIILTPITIIYSREKSKMVYICIYMSKALLNLLNL